MKPGLLLTSLLVFMISASALAADEFQWDPDSVTDADVRNGRLHALHYPVEITGVLLPYKPMQRFLSAEAQSPVRRLLQRAVGELAQFKSFGDLERWLGLQSYPEKEGSGPYFVPFKNGERPKHRMGFTVIETPLGAGASISCAECHAGNVFGRRVLGLTNRFPRANKAFVLGKLGSQGVTAKQFAWLTESTPEETALFARSDRAMRFIGAVAPVQLGLDTSLAHVALSLAKRGQDAWASRDRIVPTRPERLAHFPADSKPAVWWNVKYKNRWLSDGSVVSGNPIYTNILWNEVGRGTDLHELDRWLSNNSNVIRELTTAVFSSEAPRWTDFFAAETIDLAAAKHGQKLFNQSCAKCHGTYEKAWDRADAGALSRTELLATTRVLYQPVKPVVNVGTDPNRYQGMRSLVQLNNLEISRRNNIVIEAQEGYVPPPLVGIWARWPYFHNNSAPSLCAVLTRASQRPVTYWAREANNPASDFDRDCNGYPTAQPPRGTPRAYFFDTRREGLRNTGHDERIFLKDGQEIFSPDDKRALIQFMQTL